MEELEELSCLLVDFLKSYKVNIEVVKCEKVGNIINFYVKPKAKSKVRDIVNLRTDVSVHFAKCLSIAPLFEKGVIRVTICNKQQKPT